MTRDGQPEWAAYDAAVARADDVLDVCATEIERWTARAEEIAEEFRASLPPLPDLAPGEATPPMPAPPAAHVGAVGEIERWQQKRADALADVERAIGALVAVGALDEGDTFRSPLAWDGPTMIVADVLNRHAGVLRTVIASEDGRYVRAGAHEWAWDQETGAVIREDDVVPIRYEHWWVNGLRVGGTAHPESRGVLDSDPVR